MKIDSKRLKRIIREEIERIAELDFPAPILSKDHPPEVASALERLDAKDRDIILQYLGVLKSAPNEGS